MKVSFGALGDEAAIAPYKLRLTALGQPHDVGFADRGDGHGQIPLIWRWREAGSAGDFEATHPRLRLEFSQRRPNYAIGWKNQDRKNSLFGVRDDETMPALGRPPYSPVLPRRAPGLLTEWPAGARLGSRVFRRVGNPSENPRQKTGAQGSSGSRVAFSLVPFFWRRKRKELGRGSDHPNQITSRSDARLPSPLPSPAGRGTFTGGQTRNQAGNALQQAARFRAARTNHQVLGKVTPVWPWYLPPRSR
jgi:hypothetical protein